MNDIQTLEQELARLLEWIRSADVRVAFVVSLATAMLGILLLPTLEKEGSTCMSLSAAVLAGVLLVLGILSCAAASFPRTRSPNGSLIYFGDIGKLDLEEYKSRLGSMTKANYANDLIVQCHRNAQIASIKYSWIKRSMTFVFLSFLPWSLSIIGAYFGD